jgi:AcrR family transcriptional regulator
MERPNEGLRARKKRAAREGIAATARRLFAQRGFDAVTVVEVAAAADVSEKTVFNHFATKEDLVFAGREEHLERLLADIVGRPPGSSVLDVFRATTNTMIDGLVAGGDDALLARIISGSRALQARLAIGWEDETAALTAAIAETAGAAADDVIPALVARTLSWTHRTIFRGALDGLLVGEDRQQLVARLRVASARAYDQIATGLDGYGTSNRDALPA